jgi:hypothetical protein
LLLLCYSTIRCAQFTTSAALARRSRRWRFLNAAHLLRVFVIGLVASGYAFGEGGQADLGGRRGNSLALGVMT